MDGSTARGDVARLVNNAYRVLGAVHDSSSLPRSAGPVNHTPWGGGGTPGGGWRHPRTAGGNTPAWTRLALSPPSHGGFAAGNLHPKEAL